MLAISEGTWTDIGSPPARIALAQATSELVIVMCSDVSGIHERNRQENELEAAGASLQEIYEFRDQYHVSPTEYPLRPGESLTLPNGTMLTLQGVEYPNGPRSEATAIFELHEPISEGTGA